MATRAANATKRASGAKTLGLPVSASPRELGVDPQRCDGTATATDRWLLRRILGVLKDAPIEAALWNGELHSAVSGRQAVARVIIRDRGALIRLALHPHLYFGDDFSAGRIEVEGDLVELLEVVYRAMGFATTPLGPIAARLVRWLNRPRANTLAGSRDNIHHHYDIGNSFYRLWLDRQMVYTCAYYPTPAATLEQAQVAKMDHVCRKLGLAPGQTVIEAGCGWGALALHMARHYGVTVKAYNISHEQILYARERAHAEGLEDRVEYIEGDYRTISGQSDAFASVGMLEHVGIDRYRALGGVIRRCLKPGGRGLIHSIGRIRPNPMNGWIEKRIFPGAYPPTIREMMEIFEPHRLCVLDVENLRPHYARTLQHWLERFDAAESTIVDMFDRQFVRAWRLYLAGSIAAFRTGSLQLFQIAFARQKNNQLPWTRDYLYAATGKGELDDKCIAAMS
jgi:cyclopropane-fatty-acyl-phospholipid synthase